VAEQIANNKITDMKNRWRNTLVTLSALAAIGVPGHHAAAQGFQISAHGGAALADDVKVERFLVPVGRNARLETGGRVGVTAGYNFTKFIGAEIETGLIANEFRDLDASLAHVPMLANLVIRYDSADSKWSPYAGAGAGGDVSILSIDNQRAPNGARVDGAGGDVVFAWQAFAGVRFKLNQKSSLGAAYKFYSAEGAEWQVQNSAGTIRTGRALVHSVGIDFTVSF
jgi:opacity protein-like surface antigen